MKQSILSLFLLGIFGCTSSLLAQHSALQPEPFTPDYLELVEMESDLPETNPLWQRTEGQNWETHTNVNPPTGYLAVQCEAPAKIFLYQSGGKNPIGYLDPQESHHFAADPGHYLIEARDEKGKILWQRQLQVQANQVTPIYAEVAFMRGMD